MLACLKGASSPPRRSFRMHDSPPQAAPVTFAGWKPGAVVEGLDPRGAETAGTREPLPPRKLNA